MMMMMNPDLLSRFPNITQHNTTRHTPNLARYGTLRESCISIGFAGRPCAPYFYSSIYPPLFFSFSILAPYSLTTHSWCSFVRVRVPRARRRNGREGKEEVERGKTRMRMRALQRKFSSWAGLGWGWGWGWGSRVPAAYLALQVTTLTSATLTYLLR